MPAEQLIGFMTKNFSKFNTLVFTQTTRQEDQKADGQVKVFEERIWMKSPSYFHYQVLDGTLDRVVEPAMAYRQLLVANSAERLAQLLSDMGINLQSVGFTRIDGIIAYRIGDKAPESPKILIEKERFLPLFLQYSVSADFGERMTVRFKDYRRLEEGWFPFEVIYFNGSHIRETYSIQDLQTNIPVDPALFEAGRRGEGPGSVPEQERMSTEEERLKRIIKTFEEKYR